MSQEITIRDSIANHELSPAAQTKRIAVIGSVNIDYIWFITNFPQVSETVHANEFKCMPGGKGAVQAVACIRLSRKNPNTSSEFSAQRQGLRHEEDINIIVDFIGAVGDDDYGQQTIIALQSQGLNTEHIRRLRGVSTGQANIVVDAHGRNFVIHHPGANRSFNNQQIPFPKCTPNLVIFQFEIQPTTVWSHIREAKRRDGVIVLLNAAPAIHIPNDEYHLIDHLIVNKVEADRLGGQVNPDENALNMTDRKPQRADLVTRYKKICQAFLAKGVENVVITLGELGGVAANAQGTIEYAAHAPEYVKDQTGCGGVFIGAYAVDILRQSVVNQTFDMQRAVDWASKAAGLSTQEAGSIKGIPWGDEVE